jgi:hypothetical protein
VCDVYVQWVHLPCHTEISQQRASVYKAAFVKRLWRTGVTKSRYGRIGACAGIAGGMVGESERAGGGSVGAESYIIAWAAHRNGSSERKEKERLRRLGASRGRSFA